MFVLTLQAASDASTIFSSALSQGGAGIDREMEMAGSKGKREERDLMSRAMDVTVIATTIGGASVANMLIPGLGSAVIGAVLGAVFGFRATRFVD